jgi:hypothetical protein
MAGGWQGKLVKIDDYRWEIPKSYKEGMRVPGLVYADEGCCARLGKTNLWSRWLMSLFCPV